MNVNGNARRTIWVKDDDERIIQIIDQRALPHRFDIEDIATVDEMATAIKDMHLRGAPLIGIAAAYGMYLAALEAPDHKGFDGFMDRAAEKLRATRPTAVNLNWALTEQKKAFAKGETPQEKKRIALDTALCLAEEDVTHCRDIGVHGLTVIEKLSKKKKGETVNILTHCNAGWLATVDWGTATSPIYHAFNKGIEVHVWVDETRPRNQGASLTAWELGQHGVPHTVIVDNAGGHLMQHGKVDLVIVGSDRTTAAGDVCNKIGTYLKALAAKDNHVPFYAALPSSTIDWQMSDGVKEIPIEQRSEDEVKYITGTENGKMTRVLLTPESSPAKNYAFDVTPRKYVTGIITERGISPASQAGLRKLFPEKKVPA